LAFFSGKLFSDKSQFQDLPLYSAPPPLRLSPQVDFSRCLLICRRLSGFLGVYPTIPDLALARAPPSIWFPRTDSLFFVTALTIIFHPHRPKPDPSTALSPPFPRVFGARDCFPDTSSLGRFFEDCVGRTVRVYFLKLSVPHNTPPPPVLLPLPGPLQLTLASLASTESQPNF